MFSNYLHRYSTIDGAALNLFLRLLAPYKIVIYHDHYIYSQVITSKTALVKDISGRLDLHLQIFPQ